MVWNKAAAWYVLIYKKSAKLHILSYDPPNAAYMRQWTVSVGLGSCNGLSPVQRQAIAWTNAGLLSTEP